jgi:hypothetical protein
MKIIAIDPGKTSGYAFSDTENGKCAVGQSASIAELYVVLDEYVPDIVIVEAYKIYPNRAMQQAFSTVPSAEVIGAVRGWCYQHKCDIVLQDAAVRKVVPNEFFETTKFNGLLKGLPHARDAALHLTYYILKHRLAANAVLYTT